MKKAYIFPGQGSQFPGMGRDLYESNAKAREMMDRADRILGFSLSGTMFNGTDEQLKATEVTQPAIFLHSVCLALCDDTLPAPDMAGGHSLGEFSALVAAGAMDFEDGLKLVALRAREMQKCCGMNPGTMAAIIGLPDETVERICSETAGIVIPANYNSDGQVVISGETGAVAAACEALKAAGAKRALPLNVSGAFHSPLMEPARAELAKAIEATSIRAPFCPVYQNVDGQAHTEPAEIKANLIAQLTASVRWTQEVQAMVKAGANEFTECGPGKALQGMIAKIAKDVEGLVVRSATEL